MVDVSFVEYPLLIPIVRGLRHFNFDILSRLFPFSVQISLLELYFNTPLLLVDEDCRVWV